MEDLKKEKVAIANKRYRQLNRERLVNAKRTVYLKERLILVTCSCNTKIGMKALNKHMKSKKHSDELMKQFLNIP